MCGGYSILCVKGVVCVLLHGQPLLLGSHNSEGEGMDERVK